LVNPNNTINIIENSSIAASVNVNTTNNIGIIKAQSVDTNANGFIDGYVLTFSDNITDSSFSASNITVGGSGVTAFNTLATSNDTIARISFPDNIFHT
jgi:hypothetical protein